MSPTEASTGPQGPRRAPDAAAAAPGETPRARPPAAPPPPDGDALRHPELPAPTATPVGAFRLAPVVAARDLPLLTRWMNDPAVAAFWHLAGPESRTAAHLRPQLDAGTHSLPCLGLLDGVPMSYWEIYRADLDPLAAHYPAQPYDTGLHLLIGPGTHRGRGVGTVLLRAVTDLVLAHRPRCARVVAEPDLRNTPSVSAFLSAGFRLSAEIDLPDKRAALMICERALLPALRHGPGVAPEPPTEPVTSEESPCRTRPVPPLPSRPSRPSPPSTPPGSTTPRS
ncbi:GNAT family N-acetyltransferase [Streptomyces sp. NPDC050560]|uniref:GNAT family N-acetyltransferase n=1 Tax=Streptomyces sp. NPDC050560 TaxID=3365630 RepID=UPI0037A633E3